MTRQMRLEQERIRGSTGSPRWRKRVRAQTRANQTDSKSPNSCLEWATPRWPPILLLEGTDLLERVSTHSIPGGDIRCLPRQSVGIPAQCRDHFLVLLTDSPDCAYTLSGVCGLHYAPAYPSWLCSKERLSCTWDHTSCLPHPEPRSETKR